jgi:ATP-dependent DNA helicase RecG
MVSDIEAILRQGECSSIEFKENYSEAILETVVAFANGYNGVMHGHILLGVTDYGKIIGFNGIFNDIQQKVTNHCRDSLCNPVIAPNISLCEIENKKIIHIEVAKSNSRPHRYKGICYIRIGSTTRKATSDEEFSIREESLQKKFDEFEILDATVDDLDARLIRDYYRATRSSDTAENDNRALEIIIESLGLAKKVDGILRPTVAAMLVFGKNPQKFFPLSSVNAIRYRGNELADPILDRKLVKGTLDIIINDSADFIRKFSTIGSIISSDSIRRLDITEYPLVAIRETVSNAVTHRDYSDRGSQIDIYMFDDRVEIRNPGRLGGGITIDDFKKQTGKRWLRNPTIAGLLLELKYIEKAGTGIPRIYRVLKENGSPEPEFFVDDTSVKVILRAHPDYSARRKFEEGLLSKDRAEYDKARDFFRDAIKIRNDYIEAYIALASLEGDLRNLEEARKIYRDALKINPRNTNVYINWAALEEKNENYNDARKLYEKGIELDSNNVNLLHSWATLEKKLGLYPKARELFQRVTNLAPTQSKNWQSLGQLEIKCKKFEEAERYLLTALKNATDDYSKAWIYSDLAFALNNMRRPASEVDKHYTISLELNPNSALANHNYAQFLRSQNKNKEARFYENKAAELGWSHQRRYKK